MKTLKSKQDKITYLKMKLDYRQEYQKSHNKETSQQEPKTNLLDS